MTATGRMDFRGGVHPPERKSLSADAAIEVLPTPPEVRIPLVQHIGAPCESLVKPKTPVAMGEMIGKAGGFVSAPVHASIDGTCGMADVTTLPNARHVAVIPITAGPQTLSGQGLWDAIFGGEWPTRHLEDHAPQQIVEAIQAAGIVGQGGAAFPTHVKLVRNETKPIDTLLVNGCECEPYLTADHRMMIQLPGPIISGALLAAQAADAKQIIIAIEDNKPVAIDNLRRAVRGTKIQVVVLPTHYPMGGEKMTIRAALGRVVPTGGLPLDVGVVVINVGTAAAIARAVLRGKPLTHRVVTVTGSGVARPRNLLAPIGVSYKTLIEHCGGLTDQAARVLSGGPMMGLAIGNLDTPVTKGTSGITVLTSQEARKAEELQCIRCGRCVDVCPVGLVPTKIALACRFKDWDLARRYHLDACIECGCCAYICPSGIPLVQLMRMGKAEIPRKKK
ncbi:MAG: electron transport complex subunit RsxC [Planctomycetaceae bacterium]|nr:electron transport complex subunit RsxC [Planctomycetaceae bacterium]